MSLELYGCGLSGPMHNTIRLMPPKSNQMNWKVIKTERQYKRALVRLEQIFDARKNTRLGDELELS